MFIYINIDIAPFSISWDFYSPEMISISYFSVVWAISIRREIYHITTFDIFSAYNDNFWVIYWNDDDSTVFISLKMMTEFWQAVSYYNKLYEKNKKSRNCFLFTVILFNSLFMRPLKIQQNNWKWAFTAHTSVHILHNIALSIYICITFIRWDWHRRQAT